MQNLFLLPAVLESHPLGHTWATGGDGGGAPSLASKNLSPPLEPKIRNLQKNSGQGMGKIEFFEIVFFNFCGFLSEEMVLMLPKNLVFLSHVYNDPCFLVQKIGLPPPPPSPPLPLP